MTTFAQRAPGDQWEERLFLAPASSQSWVTANPTLRVSIEKIKDFKQVLIGGPRGGAPRELLGLAEEDLKNERSRLLMEGSAVARLERIRLVREVGGDVPAAPRDRRVTGKSPGPLKFDVGINPRSGPREPYIGDKVTSTLAERGNAAGDVWVAMEERGDFKIGDIVNFPLPSDNGGRAHLLVRDRGLAQLGGVLTLAIGLFGATPEPVPPTASSGGTPAARDPDDLRTLPVRYDGRGVRGWSFHEAAQLLTESDQDDWSVKGQGRCSGSSRTWRTKGTHPDSVTTGGDRFSACEQTTWAWTTTSSCRRSWRRRPASTRSTFRS